MTRWRDGQGALGEVILFGVVGAPEKLMYPVLRRIDALLARLLTAPEIVAPLFARDPFPATPPRFVRVAIYRYRFTDVATRHATGAWWQRELEGRSRPLDAEGIRR